MLIKLREAVFSAKKSRLPTLTDLGTTAYQIPCSTEGIQQRRVSLIEVGRLVYGKSVFFLQTRTGEHQRRNAIDEGEAPTSPTPLKLSGCIRCCFFRKAILSPLGCISNPPPGSSSSISFGDRDILASETRSNRA